MQVTIDMKFDKSRVKELRAAKGLEWETDVYAHFMQDMLEIVAKEFIRDGVHPEVIESAMKKVNTNPNNV